MRLRKVAARVQLEVDKKALYSSCFLYISLRMEGRNERRDVWMIFLNACEHLHMKSFFLTLLQLTQHTKCFSQQRMLLANINHSNSICTDEKRENLHLPQFMGDSVIFQCYEWVCVWYMWDWESLSLLFSLSVCMLVSFYEFFCSLVSWSFCSYYMYYTLTSKCLSECGVCLSVCNVWVSVVMGDLCESPCFHYAICLFCESLHAAWVCVFLLWLWLSVCVFICDWVMVCDFVCLRLKNWEWERIFEDDLMAKGRN